MSADDEHPPTRHLHVAFVSPTREDVFISGARQVGKSTLGRGIVSEFPTAEEFSLGRRETREFALSDPEGFIAALRGPVLIDEI